jgi:hypothetical protein
MEPADQPAPGPVVTSGAVPPEASRASGPVGLADARTYPHWVAGLARFLLRVFFGRVEVVGAASVPRGQPLLFVANHNNGLIDPALVLGDAAQRNEETFHRCREVLAAGGAIAIFPEGKSHSGPGLAELRTGAARILAGLPAEVRGQVAVVPVGLLYDAPGRFRSRVLVKVGEPLSAAALLTAPGAAAGAADGDVRGATSALAAALTAVTLSYGSWEEGGGAAGRTRRRPVAAAGPDAAGAPFGGGPLRRTPPGARALPRARRYPPGAAGAARRRARRIRPAALRVRPA